MYIKYPLLKTHHYLKSNFIFEFGEHNKIASTTALFIEKTCKNSCSILFLRSDCRMIDYSGYLHKKKIFFLNKYVMFFVFIFCLIFNRNIFITTLPEGASNTAARVFQFFILLCLPLYQKTIGLVVRDLKKNRAKRFLKLLKNQKVQIFAESLSLKETYEKIVNKQIYFIYSNFFYPIKNKKKKKYITFLGSIDQRRRDYRIAKSVISALPNEKYLFLGHISRGESQLFFNYQFGNFKNIFSKVYFKNIEFDTFLKSTKVFININKQEFYRNVKGSAFLGDAFFAGTKCFVPQELYNKNEDHLLIAYKNTQEIISKIKQNSISFQINKHYQNKMQKMFSNYIKHLFNNE